MTVWKWSTTAGSNDAADSTINLREGQAPSTLNNSTRAVMSAVKKWWLDLGGMIDTAGTATAYTVTTNQVLSVLTDGFQVSARLHVTNGASATLAVDGLTAKSLRTSDGKALPSGALLIGSVHTFVYDAGSDDFRVKGIFVPEGVAQTGDMKCKFTSVVDAGWLKADGRSIGNASSNAVSRANADTEALFVQLWKDYSNTLLPIQDSAGSLSTRTTGGTEDENALADYNANKRLPLPNVSGRVFAALDNISGSSANIVTDSSADTLGGVMGEEKHTLLKAELPSYNLDLSGLSISVSNGTNVQRNTVSITPATGGVTTVPAINNVNITASLSGSVPLGGSATPMNNMPPTFFGYVFIKL